MLLPAVASRPRRNSLKDFIDEAKKNPGTLAYASNGEGGAAVQAYYDLRTSRGDRLVRHVLTNLRAQVHARDRADVEGVLTVYAADGKPVLPSAAPILVADNSAEFVRGSDGAWRMKVHRIDALFRGGVPVLVPPA